MRGFWVFGVCGVWGFRVWGLGAGRFCLNPPELAKWADARG